MGLRYVKHLGTNERERIESARRKGAFQSTEDFVRKTGLHEGAIESLAEAGAFEGLGTTRRLALWQGRGARREGSFPLCLQQPEDKPVFADLGELETISWDYQASSHSIRGHPLGPLRETLRNQGLPDAKSVASMKSGSRIHYAGMVICRQRPGTASGVTFMTLEDETGFVNLVIWPHVFQDHAVLAKTAPFLGVTGKLEATTQDVVHLIVERLWRPRLHARPEHVRSRDFH